MRSFLKIVCYILTFSFLFLYPVCFAEVINQYPQYPWYFYPNKVEESWNIAKNKGEGIVVDVLDSEIEFASILKGKEYSLSTPNYFYTPFGNTSNAAELHGTAMASLIVGDNARLICDDASKRDCDFDGKIAIAGIAPKAKILSRVRYPKGDLHEALTDSINEELPRDKVGQPRRKVNRSVKLILVNVSGASNDGQIISKIKQKANIKEENGGNPYLLIIAAVGNDGKKLDGRCSGTLLPARIPRSDFSKPGTDMRDPIIRVGGTSKYTSPKDIDIFKQPSNSYLRGGSNWGEECVDILVPGDKIPTLIPTQEVKVSSSTSDAAAILTGAVALISSCGRFTDANVIRQAILDGSDNGIDSLKNKVENGRVLNIYNVVNTYCHSPEKAKFKPIKTEPTKTDDVHDDL